MIPKIRSEVSWETSLSTPFDENGNVNGNEDAGYDLVQDEEETVENDPNEG